MEYEVVLVNINKLRLHEYTDLERLSKLFRDIVQKGVLEHPIVADKHTNIVLDGNHRVTVLKLIGCQYVPTVYVDYNSPEIVVESWRGDKKFDKEDVIRAGLSNEKLPPKSTRHMIKIDDEYRHISYIQRRFDVPLKNLFSNKVSPYLKI